MALLGADMSGRNLNGLPVEQEHEEGLFNRLTDEFGKIVR